MMYALLLCLATLLLSLLTSPIRIKGQDDITGQDYHQNHVVAYEKNRLGYEKIEDYLQASVRDESAEINLIAARELLARVSKQGNDRDMPLIAALKQFVNGLDLITSSGHSCNHESYEILRTLNQATHNRAQRSQSKRGPLRRIELVLANYATGHALQCRQIYPVKFQKVFQNLKRQQIDNIDRLMTEMIQSRLGSSSVSNAAQKSPMLKRIYSSFMQNSDSFKSQRDAKMCLNHIKELAVKQVNQQDLKLLSRKQDPSSSLDRDDDITVNSERLQVKELVNKYLLEPCEYYTKQVSADIFLPALQDSKILDKSNRFKPSLNEQPEGFIYGWARYGFCFMLQRDQNILTKKIVSLVVD